MQSNENYQVKYNFEEMLLKTTENHHNIYPNTQWDQYFVIGQSIATSVLWQGLYVPHILLVTKFLDLICQMRIERLQSTFAILAPS